MAPVVEDGPLRAGGRAFAELAVLPLEAISECFALRILSDDQNAHQSALIHRCGGDGDNHWRSVLRQRVELERLKVQPKHVVVSGDVVLAHHDVLPRRGARDARDGIAAQAGEPGVGCFELAVADAQRGRSVSGEEDMALTVPRRPNPVGRAG